MLRLNSELIFSKFSNGLQIINNFIKFAKKIINETSFKTFLLIIVFLKCNNICNHVNINYHVFSTSRQIYNLLIVPELCIFSNEYSLLVDFSHLVLQILHVIYYG